MKYHRKIGILFCVLLLALTLFPGAALAADTEGTTPAPEQTERPTIIDHEEQPTPYNSAPVPPAYPAEIRSSQQNGTYYLEKIYYLSTHDDPASISTEPFDREGRHYTLLDILKNDLSETDTKEYIEVITLESESKELEKIIPMLEPKLEVTTEDGYTGILKPDYTTISVEAAGYGNSSWTASASRTYPNLSDADVSLLPKTIEDSGRTLTLANVDWQEGNTDYVDGEPMAVTYTAIASYTTTVYARYATGYTVTVDYIGDITKTSVDTIIYTAVFAAENASHGETKLEEPTPTPEPEETPEPTPIPEPEETEAPEPQKEESATRKIVILALAVVLVLAVVGFGGYKLFRYLQNKKRGYV